MVIVPVGEEGLDQAAGVLASGDVVVVPTDTVYGLAADAFQRTATDRLFAVKQRPKDVDLPVLIADADDVWRLVAELPPAAEALIAAWWPGPLTLVLRRRPRLDVDLGARADTVGVRCPDAAAVRELARRIGPLATTSANLHGRPTPATAREVAVELGSAVPLVLDGGPCAGAPSTVVDLTGDEPVVLRQGAAQVVFPG